MLNLMWHFLITYYFSKFIVNSCCPKNIHLEVRKEKIRERHYIIRVILKGLSL